MEESNKTPNNGLAKHAQEILDASPVGMLITRISDGLILFANQAIADILKVESADALVGTPVPNFYWDPEERQKVVGLVRSQGQLSGYEMRVRRSNDEMVWVSLSVRIMQFDGETSLLTSVTDITTSKLHQELSQQSEERYRNAIAAAGAVPYHIDYATEKYQFIGEAAAGLTGYTREELTPQILGAMIQETIMTGQNSGKEREDAIANTRSGANLDWRADYRIIDRNGVTRWLADASIQIVDSQGKPTGAIGILEDITERKLLEQENASKLAAEQSQRERLQAIVQYSQELMRSPDLDSLYRSTVEIAHLKLGVERCGLFLLDETTRQLTGSYGVDEAGNISDERGQILAMDPNGIESNLLFSDSNDKIWNTREMDHSALHEGKWVVVGRGWNTATLLRGPYGPVGILYNDAAISHAAYDETLQETIALYCTMVANIIQNKKIEKKIEQNQQLLQLVIDNIPQAVFWKDQELRYIGVNKAFARDSGFTNPQEMIGKTDLEMPWKDFAELYRAEDQRILETGEGILDHEDSQVAPDGSTVWVHTSKIPLRDASGKIISILGIYENVTAQKQAMETLQKREEQFRTVANFTYDWEYWVLPDGKFSYVSPSCERISGYLPEEFESDPNLFNQIINQDDLEKWDEHFQAFHTEQNPDVGELSMRITTRSGRSRWITHVCQAVYDDRGNWQGRRASNRDITKRKQIEQEMEESEARFRAIFDAANDAVFLMQGPTIVSCNPSTTRLFGAPREQIVGKSPMFFSPETQPDGQNTEQKAEYLIGLVMEGKAQVFQWKHKRLSGELFDAEVSLSRVEVGKEVFLQAIVRDISERKRIEDELASAKALSDSIINNLPVIFFMTDANGRLVRWNTVEEQVTEYSAEELHRLPVLMTIPDSDREEVAASMENVFTKGEASIETNLLTKSGKKIPYNLTGTRLDTTEGTYIVGMGIDLSARKLLEEQTRRSLERRGRQVQLSTEITQEISSAQQLGELFKRVVNLVKERFGYYHTQILRYDEAQNAVVLVFGYGDVGQEMMARQHRMELGAGLVGRAASSGATLMRPNLSNDPDWHPNPLLPETQGEIAVPIKLRDQVLGVLDVQSNLADEIDDDDRLVLEGLCGQIAIAIDNTRLREEMSENIEEITRLYRAMSQEGWRSFRQTESLPTGYVYDQTSAIPVEDEGTAVEEDVVTTSITVPGGEILGTLSIQDDPERPLSEDDQAFLQQIAEQIALAMESARLFQQTQTALAQSEALFQASSRLTQATSLNDLVQAVAETMDIPSVNRISLNVFNYDSAGVVDNMEIAANWWNGTGMQASPVGTRFTKNTLQILGLFLSPTPVFFDDAFNDERIDAESLQIIQRLNIRAGAVLPLFAGTNQIGVLIAQSEDVHKFSQDETRLFSALAPQISTVLENRRQFERAQKQAEREAMLNVIGQKIQSATSVDAVLQIAARELGHALGAPITVAQLSLKDTKK